MNILKFVAIVGLASAQDKTEAEIRKEEADAKKAPEIRGEAEDPADYEEATSELDADIARKTWEEKIVAQGNDNCAHWLGGKECVSSQTCGVATYPEGEDKATAGRNADNSFK